MKKIYVFGLAIAAVAALASCNKENTIEEPNNLVTLEVSTEKVEDPETKVSIVESGSNFYLNWQTTDSFTMGNSNRETQQVFTIGSASGTNATFSGTLPDASGGSTTNYIAAFNVNSVSGSNVRATIPVTQDYATSGALATNCLLVAREDGITVGSLSTLHFKTMNAFMKFSLTKGDAAGGSSTDYSSHMYVRSIVVETIADGEYISGRFGISKTASDWDTSDYAEVVTASASKKVTLNCVTTDFTNGVDLSDVAKDFYVAIAYGDYSKGLRVTITVENGAGKYGKFVKTISKDKTYSIARNTLRALPTLEVNPTDAVPEITLWSENWNGGTAGDAPSAYLSGSHSGTYVYSGSVTYTQNSDSNVVLYDEALAGGTSPELFLKKSGSRSWTVSGIPTAGAEKVQVTYKANNGNNAVTCSTAGTSITGSSGDYVVTTGGAATLTLVFANTSSKATRIDDIVVKVTND